ncbi:LLM class flavin-dependent oxidoreductase [Actinocrispum sp. NPDC049592]|uniref:LLM class flavin-dependent oxidoreductase n=1 Tax=Actinocrispum sp. NPDC049592 TaxID=3154835 RepID=UPI003442EC77
MRFGLIADFRTGGSLTSPEVVADTIDHIVWAESLGFSHAVIGEHHFADDSFLPSPLVAATAIAARTTSMRVATNVALLPLYHPVRLAEDAAVLDVVSGGRLDLGVGVGYNPVEFAGYGVDRKSLGARANAVLDTVKRLWLGETVTVHNDFFDIDGARVTPRPVQDPHPPIWVGGLSRAAVRRAARYGDAYTGPANPQVWQSYLDALAEQGKDPATARINLTGTPWFFVSSDPERLFAELAPPVLNWAGHMARTAGLPPIGSIEELRKSGQLTVVTPAEGVTWIKNMAGNLPVDMFGLRIAPPGVPVRRLREHFELFAREVIPQFQ